MSAHGHIATLAVVSNDRKNASLRDARGRWQYFIICRMSFRSASFSALFQVCAADEAGWDHGLSTQEAVAPATLPTLLPCRDGGTRPDGGVHDGGLV